VRVCVCVCVRERVMGDKFVGEFGVLVDCCLLFEECCMFTCVHMMSRLHDALVVRKWILGLYVTPRFAVRQLTVLVTVHCVTVTKRSFGVPHLNSLGLDSCTTPVLRALRAVLQL